MKNAMVVVVGSLAVLAIATGGVQAKGGHETHTLFSFATMYGVDGPFVGETNPINGVIGDELPWEIKVGKGGLKTNGHLKVKVRGLVFKDAPEVPADKKGINDEAEFR